MVTTRQIHSGQPCTTRSCPPTRPEQNITGPMEKSMPPVAITKVTPSARKPMKSTVLSTLPISRGRLLGWFAGVSLPLMAILYLLLGG